MEKVKKQVMHGWFSQQQADMGGTSFYSLLGGGEVEISQVTSTTDHGTMWPDIKYVGEVLDHLRTGVPDPWGFMDHGLWMDYDDPDDLPDQDD